MEEWLNWLLETAGPKIFFVVFLTGAFGLRCGEALALKREDLNLVAVIPKLVVTGESAGARKSSGEVYVRVQHVKVMKKWLREGIPNIRKKKHKHGKGEGEYVLCRRPMWPLMRGTCSGLGGMPPGRSCITMQCTIRFVGKLLNSWPTYRQHSGNGARRLPHSGRI